VHKKLTKDSKISSSLNLGEDPIRQYYIQSALEMREAWFNFIIPPNVDEIDWRFANDKENLLKSFSSYEKYNRDRKDIFTLLLLRGEIETRKFMERSEFGYLVGFLKTDQISEEIRRGAIRVLTLFSYPDEFRIGIRDAIQKEGVFYQILELACSGECPVHHQISKQEIIFGEKLADGATSVVFSAIWKGKKIAIKSIKDNTKFTIENLRRELSILSTIEHENLLVCYGGNPNERFIVTELMEKGSLYDFLRTNPHLDLYAQLSMMIDIARGMAYLHSLNFIHRDLKSVNILIASNNRLKISDFGSSRVLDLNNKMTATLGTLSWIPPEIFNDEKYSQSADVYSFAIVMWEIMTKKIPYEGRPLTSIPVAVTKGERPIIPQSCPRKLGNLITKSWSSKQQKKANIFRTS